MSVSREPCAVAAGAQSGIDAIYFLILEVSRSLLWAGDKFVIQFGDTAYCRSSLAKRVRDIVRAWT